MLLVSATGKYLQYARYRSKEQVPSTCRRRRPPGACNAMDSRFSVRVKISPFVYLHAGVMIRTAHTCSRNHLRDPNLRYHSR